jgi:hypothetical protein
MNGWVAGQGRMMGDGRSVAIGRVKARVVARVGGSGSTRATKHALLSGSAPSKLDGGALVARLPYRSSQRPGNQRSPGARRGFVDLKWGFRSNLCPVPYLGPYGREQMTRRRIEQGKSKPWLVKGMNLRMLLFAVGIVLLGTILLFASGFGEVELLVDGQCGATGYLCEAPTADHADYTPIERRYGSR